MNFNLSPKQNDPQRLLKLNGVPREFWLGAEEINQIISAIKHLLGEEDELYKGEFPVMEALEFKYPNPDPGSYAQIKGNPNQEAIWDASNYKWIIKGDWQPAPSLEESVKYFQNFSYFPQEGFEDELYIDKEAAKIYLWDDFEELYITEIQDYGDKNTTHEQSTPSSVWTINHNMGKYPSVTIIDSAGSEVEGEVVHTNENSLKIIFGSGFSGIATLN